MTHVPARSTASGPRRGLVVLCLAVVALGVFADQGQRLPGFWADVPELGTPWVLVGFAAGRLLRQRALVAVLVGMAGPVAALWTYYLYLHLEYGTNLYNAMNGSRGWYLTLLAAFVGGASGLAGALTGATRPLTRTIAWSFVVAVPAVEAWRVQQYGDARLGLQALLVVTSLCLFAWALGQRERWRPLLVSTLAWVTVGLVALAALRAAPI